MTFYINLAASNAVTLGLYDQGSQADGWVTKAGQNDNVQICFHNNGVPTLLPAGTPILFGCKVLDEFNAPTYLMETAAFAVPADPTVGFYTGGLVTNTITINTALGSTDGGNTAGNLPSIPTTSCEIEWGSPCTKSQTFSVEIDNTPNRGNEVEPGTPTGPLNTLLAQLGALTTLAGMYAAGFFLVAPVGCDFRQQRNAMYAGVV